MPAAKVEPEPPPAAPAGDLKVPRAPLLKRLMEIESTIANIKAPDNLDGYKTLDLHTAARRGDMRAVAALVPNHMASMRLRDEAGWMPIHHATCAGRRCVFRVPCHTTKMVDLHEREKVADDVVNLLEAATQKVEDDEHNAEIDGTGPVDISFSEKMARALDGYLPHAHAPGLGPVGAPLPLRPSFHPTYSNVRSPLPRTHQHLWFLCRSRSPSWSSRNSARRSSRRSRR